jgi:Ca-activated chloride channel family protein
MKYAIILSLLALFAGPDPWKIGRINGKKKEARQAYSAGDYKKAIQTYRYLVDSLGVSEDEITFNLANAYYLTKDTANAQSHYATASQSEKPYIRSRAEQQLGMMANRSGKQEEALNHFKQAIKADPQNDDARYDYEMLKKKLNEEKEKNKDKDKNKPDKPSEYAKKLKAQADALSAQYRFGEAHNLMTEGAQKDPSVMYYKDFIDRLNDVATINQSKK